jgi:cobalt-zinc-cadmium efflux system membrane fusion protein
VKKIIFNLRWGKVAVWALLVVAGASAVAGYLFMMLRGENARGADPTTTDGSRAARPTRPADDTILLPPRVLRSLGIHTKKVLEARQPRTLPSLAGTLALDSNRLVRVHSRFPGEVVKLGTTDEYDPTKGAEASAGRTLRYGDSVRKKQLLAVVWSKDLGEKKSELVDAASKLKLDREVLERLQGLLKEGGTSERSVREAERAVDSDLIAVARAERTLRSWRLDEEAIAAVRAEAERLGRQAGAADESWARVEIRSPQDGVLLEKNVSKGDIVDTSADLFKIADLSKLAFWAHAYEEELPTLQQLHPGSKWTIRLPSRPGETFEGVFERVGAVIDPNQHTALVYGRVDNAAGQLRVGQFVTAEVQLMPERGELEVPTAALVEDGRASIVFVQPDPEKPVFVRRRVQVVRRFDDVVHLRAGAVQRGEFVVDSGAVLLNEAIEDLPVGK